MLLNLERKMESGRLAQDTGRMRFASSSRSTNKVQLGIPQTDSTTVFYATLSLSIFLSRIMGAGALFPAGKSVQAGACVESLARRLPCALLFSPGHSVPSVNHFTGNDVAIGSYAQRELVAAGCRSFAVIQTGSIFHAASVVRGRAFSDRIPLRGALPHFYCRKDARRFHPPDDDLLGSAQSDQHRGVRVALLSDQARNSALIIK